MRKHIEKRDGVAIEMVEHPPSLGVTTEVFGPSWPRLELLQPINILGIARDLNPSKLMYCLYVSIFPWVATTSLFLHLRSGQPATSRRPFWYPSNT